MNRVNDFFWRHPHLFFVVGVVIAAVSAIAGVLSYGYVRLWQFILLISVIVCGVWMALEGWEREFKYSWQCPKCGRETIAFRDKYCSDCGSKMTPVPIKSRKCPNGHKVGKYDVYCPKCGQLVPE